MGRREDLSQPGGRVAAVVVFAVDMWVERSDIHISTVLCYLNLKTSQELPDQIYRKNLAQSAILSQFVFIDKSLPVNLVS